MNLLLRRFPSILTTLEVAQEGRDQFQRLLSEHPRDIAILARSRNDSMNLNLGYGSRMIRIGMGVFVLMVSAALVLPEPSVRQAQRRAEQLVIQMDEIPETRQLRRPPPPPRPAVPIETESEDVPDDVTIESTDLDFDDILELPPPSPDLVGKGVEEDEPIELWAVEDKPTLTHSVTPEYPLIALKAGIQDVVLVRVLIGKDGLVKEASVMRGKEVFHASALEAVRQYVFSPALQNDKPVPVWMALPIRFRLVE
jgi:protein TonB